MAASDDVNWGVRGWHPSSAAEVDFIFRHRAPISRKQLKILATIAKSTQYAVGYPSDRAFCPVRGCVGSGADGKWHWAKWDLR